MSEPVAGAPGAMLVIISGPSGVGKDTILRELKEGFPDPRRRFVVTYKSRQPRPGEVDGVDYHFVSPDAFRRLRRAGAFLETAKVHRQWSGTPRDQVVAALTDGNDAILKIDVQGAMAVRDRVPGALLIFVRPPSVKVLKERLKRRGTESSLQLAIRHNDAVTELASMGIFDHVVVNEDDQVAGAARHIDEILRREHELRRDDVVIV